MKAAIDIPRIERAWQGFSAALGLRSLRTEADYDRALKLVERILDETRGSRNHPLRNLLDWFTPQIEEYETRHYSIPEVKGHEALAFLMEQHGLRQSDLPEVGAQSVVSAVLGGKRRINARQAKLLARRFGCTADVFL